VAEAKSIPLADPAPLGLSGFAITTFVLSLINAGLLKLSDIAAVIGLAVFYGGIAQLLAGMWEFRNGNTFGATAFTSYGAFWLSFAALLIPGFGASAALTSGGAIGSYLLGWTIFTLILTIGTFRLNGALVTVFILLLVTFALLTIGAYTGAAAITHIGGYIGIATAVAAWYTAAAGILSAVSGGKVVLPTYPFVRMS